MKTVIPAEPVPYCAITKTVAKNVPTSAPSARKCATTVRIFAPSAEYATIVFPKTAGAIIATPAAIVPLFAKTPTAVRNVPRCATAAIKHAQIARYSAHRAVSATTAQHMTAGAKIAIPAARVPMFA